VSAAPSAPARAPACAALVAATAIGLGAPRAARPARAQPPAGTVYVGVADSAAHVYRGDRSGFADAARLVVRDADAWRRVWAVVATGRADTLVPPAVDFRREIVIVAALGARPAAGYRVAIDTVRRGDFAVEAVVRTVEPGAGCAASFAVVEPVDVVRVPRTERPIAFTERRATAPCPR
jgi:hypothetical protein